MKYKNIFCLKLSRYADFKFVCLSFASEDASLHWWGWARQTPSILRVLTHHWDKESEWQEPGTKSGKPAASSAPVTWDHKGVVGREKTQQILKR